MPTPQPVLSTQQAARLLSLSVSSVQKMVARGELEAWVTPGGHRRILATSVQRWLGRQEPPATPAPAAGVPERLQRTRLQVLLAEDEPAQQQYLRRLLDAHGSELEVAVAADASQALILMERQRPDLVITDLVMRPFDGFHLVRTIQAEPAWAGTEVLVLSALGDDEVRQRGGLPPGVTRYIKPVAAERLLGFVDAVWARHQRRLPAGGAPSGPTGGAQAWPWHADIHR